MKLRPIALFTALLLLCSPPIHASYKTIDKTVRSITKEITKGLKRSKDTVVIPHFVTLEEKNTLLGKLISQKLIVQFAKTKKIIPLERDFILKLTEEMKLGMTGLIDPGTLKQIGKFFGANYVLLGTMQKVGKTIQVTARLVHTETAKVIKTAESTIKAYKDVIVLLDHDLNQKKDNSVRKKKSGRKRNLPEGVITRSEKKKKVNDKMSAFFHFSDENDADTGEDLEEDETDTGETIVLDQDYYENEFKPRQRYRKREPEEHEEEQKESKGVIEEIQDWMQEKTEIIIFKPAKKQLPGSDESVPTEKDFE